MLLGTFWLSLGISIPISWNVVYIHHPQIWGWALSCLLVREYIACEYSVTYYLLLKSQISHLSALKPLSIIFLWKSELSFFVYLVILPTCFHALSGLINYNLNLWNINFHKHISKLANLAKICISVKSILVLWLPPIYLKISSHGNYSHNMKN